MRTIVLTNGAGGKANCAYAPGRVVLISDHINLTAHSPLIGTTFIDLTNLYSSRLRGLVRKDLPGLQEGIYVQLPGPQYETPTEIRMLAVMGGDLVGVSTTIEAIATRESGMELLGLSLVTNHAAGRQDTALNHMEALDAGTASDGILRGVLSATIRAIDTDLGRPGERRTP